MQLPSIPRTVKRGVGRRIMSYFLLAGLVPLVFTVALAYHEFGRGLKQDVQLELREHAKDYGLELLFRLQQLSAVADELATVVVQQEQENLSSQSYLLRNVQAAWIVSESDGPRMVHGNSAAVVPIADSVVLSMAAPLPKLVTSVETDRESLVFLRRLESRAGKAAALVVKPDPAHLWGNAEDLPFATAICAWPSAGRPMYCTQPMPVDILEAASSGPAGEASTLLEWELDGEPQLASIWQLFLAVDFDAPAIDIIASQPAAHAMQSRTDFSRVFIPALALVVIVIGLLSFNMIGRSLRPLRTLTIAARQLASGNLLSRVRIRSDDEFEWLGEAFNTMASRLSRQIATLEAMSSIDRLILAGAGFEEVSENVVRHLLNLTGCKAAGVIARDPETPHWAKMISLHNDKIVQERISLPMELGHNWCQPRQVSIEQVKPSVAPYKARFLAYHVRNVVLIPVVLNGELKGMLLLGAPGLFNLKTYNMSRCVDLAGRFAVALSSAEREEALYRQAHYDELTGLPNRQLLKDRLAQQVVQSRRDETTGALLYLDLDRFKEINDVHGHSVGDIVLAQAAERIVAELRDSDTVSRLGGDEFVVIMPHVEGESHVRATATRLLERISESFSVGEFDHYVGCSIGIVMFPDDGDSVETLLKNADSAMYRAKDAGRARFEFFSEKLNAVSRRKISLERDLRIAFGKGELKVCYQPQVDISTGVISGAEALLRWEHPVVGAISPDEFVPLAEDSDLIVDIGRWVIEQACVDMKRVFSSGLHPGPVSINVSARQLSDDRFVSDVLEPLRNAGINPAYFQLEVTETAVAQNRDTATELLQELRAQGIRVAIDDFGTGYSSLSYLQHMPFDVIKVDKTFVDDIGALDTPSDNICRTIIRMAHEMGKTAIAEGVETKAQAEFLKKNGCNFAQGYYYASPLTKEEFVAFVEKEDFHTQRRKALEIVQ